MLSALLFFRYWVLRKMEYFGLPCAVFIMNGMKGKSKGLSHNLPKSVTFCCVQCLSHNSGVTVMMKFSVVLGHW